MVDKTTYYGTGRRKSSIARVTLAPGKGKILMNGKPFKDYLCRDTLATIVSQPLVLTESDQKFDVKIKVNGGGLSGQAGAARLGISRALLVIEPDFRTVLKSSGFLTRDSRKVERQKPGQPGARKRFQFSKR